MIIGFGRDGWFVGQANYPFLLEPIFWFYPIKMAEVIVYQAYGSTVAKPLPIRKIKGASLNVSKALLSLSKIFALVGFAILFFSYAPILLSRLANYHLSQVEVKNLSRSTALATNAGDLPPFNPNLPHTNRLIIPSIGVNTDIEEATYNNYEVALRKGVWRVSDFGAPGETGSPVILAAHRFGYLAWSNLYRRQNSFYNLPKLNVGDRIEIDYQQRKYTYEVYAEGKGPEIMDYTADLILYTCEYLTGETRVFRYAKLVAA